MMPRALPENPCHWLALKVRAPMETAKPSLSRMEYLSEH